MKKIKGLLLKDILQSKSYLFIYIFVYIIFAVVGIFLAISSKSGTEYFNDPNVSEESLAIGLLQSSILSCIFVFCLSPMYAASGITLSFQQDEKWNFDKFAVASGISRKSIVTEKFCFGLLVTLPSFIVSVIVAIVIAAMNTYSLKYLVVLYCLLINIGGLLIHSSVALVFNTFLGSVKGRVWLSIATIFGLLLEGGIFYFYVGVGINNILYGSLITFGFLLISIGIAIGLYFLSLKAYLNKEF